MTVCATGGWGSGPWGGMPWGGGGSGIEVSSVLSVRENVIRLGFTAPVYYSGILDPADASDPSRYVVSAVDGTGGLDGNPARAVTVVEVLRPTQVDGLTAAEVGRFLDIVLDRPMTPFPALYDVVVGDVFTLDLSEAACGTFRTAAVFKRLAPPTLETASPSRDIANPQTLSAARASVPDPTSPFTLGSIRVDDSGDYAFDEGIVNYRKRVIRRVVTRYGGFAHLPTYGVGIPDQSKRLAIGAVVADLAARAEAQIGLEPDTAQVRVRLLVDRNTPGLVRYQIAARPKQGPPQAFVLPIEAAGG